jgi:prepilin signal peptidase PulO-like enzyme (type II secretory pathway)
MNGFIALPLPIRLALIALLGAVAGAAANWAIYAFAWRRRAISPWLAPPDGASPRRAIDRVPIVGWLTLRRESRFFGRGFWIRPLVIEVLLAAGLAALYAWEVELRALHIAQLQPIVGRPVALRATFDPVALHAMFFAHALIIVLMTAASFIDIDDWIIPDAITVVGTLLGLVLAAAVPFVLLPQIEVFAAPPLGGRPVSVAGGGIVQVQGNTVYTTPLFLSAPRDWPARLAGMPRWQSLLLGLAGYWLWCFALVPRIWRGRRGAWFALRLIAVRVWRELRRPMMLLMEIAGSLGIGLAWWTGGLTWAALLTAIVGMIAGGGIVWVVRLIGAVALRREAMGFGDVTLMMMIGTFLGWQAALFVFFLAPVAGLVVGVLRLLLFRDHELPYGPFLCLAALAVMVHWGGLWNWARPIFSVPGLVPAALAVCIPLMFGLLWLMRLIFHRQE